MTCAELQQELPEIIEGDRTGEQETHLKTCRTCSGLLTDLKAISELAVTLQGADEPSPRVWNSIEIALRKEGLIRQPQREPRLAVVPAARRRSFAAWLLPVAAAALIVFGLLEYKRPSPATNNLAETRASDAAGAAKAQASGDQDDEQVLDIVAARVPAMRAAYANNLKRVNDYIRDAKESVRRDPNDEQAQQALMTAYEQKSVVYEMAMDRSLP